MSEKIKAVVMFSGGLDSTLAAKMMLDQGIELLALHLTSLFCTCDRRKSGCRAASSEMADQLGLKMITVPKGTDYYRMIKNPRYGYGSALNPCIDCRIYGLQKAKEYMEREGARFVVTGEVLSQRPMSQMRHVLRRLEKQSGLEGLILRPLSAKNLPPTIPEMEGWVDRHKLLSITGRSRKTQMRLAEEFDLKNYPCPAGGCLLTDKGYVPKVKDLFDHSESPEIFDFNLLKIGRHLRLPSGEKLIIPRNEEENRRLELSGRGRLVLVCPDGFPGPVLGIQSANAKLPLREISYAFGRYARKAVGPYPVTIQFPEGTSTRTTISLGKADNCEVIENYILR